MAQNSFRALFQMLKKLVNGFLLFATFPLIIISKLETFKEGLACVFKPFVIIGQNLLAVTVRIIHPCITLGTSLGQMRSKSQTGFYSVGKCITANVSTMLYLAGMFMWNIFSKLAHVLFLTKKLQVGCASSKHKSTGNLKRSS